MFGFTASSLNRLMLGAVFCLVASGLVWAVERPREAFLRSTPEATPSILPKAPIALVIESTYPVTNWQVSTDGVRSDADHSTAWSWTGTVPGVADGEVLVVAPAVAGDTDPNRCLRLRLGTAAPTVVWGGGDVTATLAIP
jgi:hypothetical protein